MRVFAPKAALWVLCVTVCVTVNLAYSAGFLCHFNAMPLDQSTAFCRRQIPVTTANGSGDIAGLQWGPEGDGPLDILFLHANGFNAMTYAQLMAPLGAQGLRVLAVDLRGHGLTTLPAEPEKIESSWDSYRDDLMALLAALGPMPRVLAGHSMGGATCMLAALTWPQALGAVPPLVLFDPVIAPPMASMPTPSPLKEGALRRKNNFDSPEAALAGFVGRGAFKTWPESFIRDYLVDGIALGEDGVYHLTCAPTWEANNFSHPYRTTDAAIPGLVNPLTVLRAELASTCHWNQWPAQAQVQTVPGSTHFVPMEFPELAREALVAAVEAERALAR